VLGHVRDLVLRIKDGEQAPADRLGLCKGFQFARADGVLFPDPGQRALAGAIFQPKLRVFQSRGSSRDGWGRRLEGFPGCGVRQATGDEQSGGSGIVYYPTQVVGDAKSHVTPG